MAANVAVVLDRSPGAPLNLADLIAPGTLKWSSVVPGGFASFQATLTGDPRKLTKEIPYLAIVRVVGSSGRVLFEGQIEDKQVVLSGSDVGLSIVAFGLQNALKEQSLRRIWSKRDMAWADVTTVAGMKTNSSNACVLGNNGWQTNSGQFDPTNASRTGVQVVGVAGAALALRGTMASAFTLPLGLVAQRFLGTCTVPTSNSYSAGIWAAPSGVAFGNSLVGFGGAGTNDFDVSVAGAAQIRVGAWINSTPVTITPNDGPQFYNMRVLGTTVTEDVAAFGHAGGSFYGDTLIKDLLAQVPALSAGTIESGSDFSLDHLDAGVRRAAADILDEIASYYTREWAVWEENKLSWVTPNLQQNQWIVPIAQLAGLNLDGSVVNSQQQAILLYTDASTGLDAEQSFATVDRRNPYVLGGRAKDKLVQAGTMTQNTAAQLAAAVMGDLGYGPVPAAGTAEILGDRIVQHAQGNAVPAWEIRAGDNVTIPELPMVDVFTRDGRGEVLFHVVSAEADGETGIVTLTLDSYGSKRSDVLLARLAAVTNLLGG